MTPVTVDLERVRRLVAEVPDPEVPVLTIDDLGVLRSVELDADGKVIVTITPTYSGCPAMHHIEQAILSVLTGERVEGDVRTVHSPAWTTEWMSAEGRSKLREYGIAPPRPMSTSESMTGPMSGPMSGPVSVSVAVGGTPDPRPVECPQCGSEHTETVSQFGSTACKSLHRCLDCREPFDHFKEL